MENEEKNPSIFEQEDYDGGFGSGPLTAAPDSKEDKDDKDGEAATEDMGLSEEA